jgi:hypothetical protein
MLFKKIPQLELQDEARKAGEWYMKKNYMGIKLDVQERMRLMNASAQSFFMGVRFLEKKLLAEAQNERIENGNGKIETANTAP